MSESGLNRKLHDLLYREAHLKLCRARMTPLWMEKQSELRAVHATRPPFLLVRSGKTKDEYHGRATKAEQELERLRQRMQMLDLCEPHIAKLIEYEIELLLREQCPEYIQALAALRQKEDWLRCLERFDVKIFEFTRALGNVRNLACSGYSREKEMYSTAAGQAFSLAYEAAEHVEEEVRFANRISDAQLGLLEASGVKTKPLPRLPETSFTAWVDKIKSLPLAEAQVQFDELIEITKALHTAGVPELRAQAQQVEEAQGGDIRNFLLAAWEQFRAEIAPEIFPGDTERVVADTENMLTAAARASVVGRL